MTEKRAVLPENWNERPDEWMGGCDSEEPAQTHLQSPKTSWLASSDSTEAVRRKTSPAIGTDLSALTQSDKDPDAKNSDDKMIHLQREKFGYIAERPDDWMSNGGRVLTGSTHKTKLRTSWMHKDTDLKVDAKATVNVNANVDAMSQSMNHLSIGYVQQSEDDPLHASESQISTSKKERRMTSPLILQRLSLLKQKSEENHKANEFWEKAAEHSPPGPLVKAMAAPEAKPKVENEQALDSVSMHAPDMAQSMRDHSSGETKLESMNASDSHLCTGKRRTSTLIQQKLQSIEKANEENHKKNEEFAAAASKEKALKAQKALTPSRATDNEDASKGSEETPKYSESIGKDVQHVSPTTTKESVRLQREDHNRLAARPGEWLGGSTPPSQGRKPIVSIPKHIKLASPTGVVSRGLCLGGADESSKGSKDSELKTNRLQREDHNFCASRPGDWLGGSEDAAPTRSKAVRRKTSPFALQNPLVQ